MGRQSSLRRLPTKLRDEVHALIEQGRTVDEIHGHLQSLGADVSRSAVGRYRKSVDEMARDMRKTREMAEVLVRELGNAPEERVARANIGLLEGAIFAIQQAEGDELDPKAIALLARASKNLVQARTVDAALAMKLREEGRKAAEEDMERAAKAVSEEAGDAPMGPPMSPLDVFERIKAVYRGEA